jgi:hypothetical protein
MLPSSLRKKIMAQVEGWGRAELAVLYEKQ